MQYDSEDMSKSERRRLRKLEKAARQQKSMERRVQELEGQTYAPSVGVKFPVSAETEAQGHYIISIGGKQITFGIGPAGTGKTYVAASLAAQALVEGKIDKIICTRPIIEVGTGLGFLPGTMEEKYGIYLMPLADVFSRQLSPGNFDYMTRHEMIQGIPLDYMRGITFRDCIVILDEAQNVTPSQMKMFLTRIGHNATVIINGDPNQQDIEGPSGLMDAVSRIEHIPQVGVVEFDKDDVVRSGIVKQIIAAYED